MDRNGCHGQEAMSRRALTELHCHILPRLDDGASSPEMALRLLRREQEAGVRRIAFTPHFYGDRCLPEQFFAARDEAYAALLPACRSLDLQTIVGAEVHMVPQLLRLPRTALEALCYEGTGYLLLEWPHVGIPLWGEEVVDRILAAGLRPIFAHIERCPHLFRDEALLAHYFAKGALFQLNTSALREGALQKRSLALVRRGYIHILATDAHDPVRRPPLWQPALELIGQRAGKETLVRLLGNADELFRGRELRPEKPRPAGGLRRLLGR